MALATAPGIGTDPSKATRSLSARQKAEWVWIFRPDLRVRMGPHGPIAPSLTSPGVEWQLRSTRTGYVCPCPAQTRCYHLDGLDIAREFYAGDPDVTLLRYYRFVDGQVRVREAAFA